EQGLVAFSKLGIAPPAWLFLSLLDVGAVKFVADFDSYTGFDRNILGIPEQRIDDFASSPWSILKPVADMIWNAAGLERCYRINEQGKWVELQIDRFNW